MWRCRDCCWHRICPYYHQFGLECLWGHQKWSQSVPLYYSKIGTQLWCISMCIALCLVPEVFPFLRRRHLPQSCIWVLRVWKGTRHTPDEHIWLFSRRLNFIRYKHWILALVALTYNFLSYLWHELGACVHHNWINVNHVDVCWTLPVMKNFKVSVEFFNARKLVHTCQWMWSGPKAL